MSKLIRIIICLMVLISLKQSCASESKPATNHVIKFIGMSNGYQNTTAASEALASNLRVITNSSSITIDSLDELGASWHSDELGSKTDFCPEGEIIRLLDTIKPANSSEYTRKFKMDLTEHFTVPKDVAIDWFGPCENLGRKRSQVGFGRDGSTASSESIEIETVSVEPEAPSTTITEAQSTTPSVTELISEETTTTGENEETTTSTSLEFDTDADLAAFTTGFTTTINKASVTTMTTTTATSSGTLGTMTTTTTTTAPIADNRESSTPIDITTTSTTEVTEAEPSTEPISSIKSTIVVEDPSEPVDLEEVSTTGTDIITDGPDLSSNRQASPYTTMEPSSMLTTSGSPSDGAAFGKYIGLTAGFLIFVAYLICSRACRRQGMYELQN